MPTKDLHLDDRTAIHYAHAGATTLPGTPPRLDRGATLVFLHGEGGSAALWRRAVVDFGADHSPLAIDLPGHGRSSGLEGPATVEAAAALLARVLEGLAALIGLWMTHPASGISKFPAAPVQPITDGALEFSARQLAILRLVARDKTNESIAAHLNVSVSTVKHEIQRLLRALRSDDRHGAVAHARALGLFAEPES